LSAAFIVTEVLDEALLMKAPQKPQVRPRTTKTRHLGISA